MANEGKMLDAVEQLADRRGPVYMKYLVNSRAGFLRELARLEAEIIRLEEEEASSR